MGTFLQAHSSRPKGLRADPLATASVGSEKGHAVRPRRLRRDAALREWVAESRLEASRLVYPIFVRPGDGPSDGIGSLPGIYRRSVEEATRHAGEAYEAGIRAIWLRGQARRRDARGSEAFDPKGVVPRTVRAVKQLWADLVVITDDCLCAYTDHGHCGVLDGKEVDNDRTLELLGRIATVHAAAGADLVAPTAMMDHQVAHVRAALDDGGFSSTGIVGGSARFASAFYGGFDDSADPPPVSGDRSGYQIDVRNPREAQRELDLDVAEGADMVMVKPALPCLDVIARARAKSDVPILAFQVGGEYAMLKAAVERRWLFERDAAEESLHAIRRAGADMTVSYYALQVARWSRSPTDE
jgi:porphobilinogen synthase